MANTNRSLAVAALKRNGLQRRESTSEAEVS